MKLGNFSLSLNVKDINASADFYGKLGFKKIGGDISQNWLIVSNGETTIGLFQGMFDKNMMTFNPGWDNKGQNIKEFTDIRALQKALELQKVNFDIKADEDSTGPASFMITDPDGNPILVDQHR